MTFVECLKQTGMIMQKPDNGRPRSAGPAIIVDAVNELYLTEEDALPVHCTVS